MVNNHYDLHTLPSVIGSIEMGSFLDSDRGPVVVDLFVEVCCFSYSLFLADNSQLRRLMQLLVLLKKFPNLLLMQHVTGLFKLSEGDRRTARHERYLEQFKGGGGATLFAPKI
jgi:hypothetical protein